MTHPIAQIALDPALLQSAVNTRIHDADNMSTSTPERYFSVGRSAIAAIGKAMVAHGFESPQTVLDFACGLGRVCRYLRAAFPEAEITAADVWTKGVEFCAAEFDADALISPTRLDDLALPRSYDLIWCGSLVTHLTEPRSTALLDGFAKHLTPRGVMVFTTHGRNMYRRRHDGSTTYNITDESFEAMAASYLDGSYGFAQYGHETPYGDDYGISMTPLGWIYRYLLARDDDLAVVSFSEAGWDDHQDVVAFGFSPVAHRVGKITRG